MPSAGGPLENPRATRKHKTQLLADAGVKVGSEFSLPEAWGPPDPSGPEVRALC